MTKVVAGFPGVGKSVLSKNSNLNVLDSDSSKFSWIEPGVRHPDFPQNYINHIKVNIGVADIILVSSHDVVRKALAESGIEYYLVYPDISLKEEYLDRYRQRGNDEKFIALLKSKWEEFILSIEEETFPTLLKLSSNQYLSDVIGGE